MALFARNYPTGIYGQLVTLITLSAVFISIFDLGLPIYIQREMAVNKNGGSEIFSRIFLTGTLMIILYFAAGSAAVSLIYSEIPYKLFALTALFMYSSFLVTLAGKALAGMDKYREQFTAYFIAHLITAGFFIAGLYYFYFTLSMLLSILLAGTGLNILLLIFYLYKSGISITFRNYTFDSVKKILSVSVILGLAVVFNFLYDKIDILIISKLRSFDETAYYNAAYGLFKSSSILFSFMLVSGFTQVAGLGRDPLQIREFYKSHWRAIMIICAASALALFLFAEPVINLIYTGKFENSVLILRILSFGIIAMGLNNLTGIILNGMGYFKIVMFITLYALIMNALLNLYLLPKFGITASAVLTVFTELFIFITEWYYMRKILLHLSSGQKSEPVKA